MVRYLPDGIIIILYGATVCSNQRRLLATIIAVANHHVGLYGGAESQATSHHIAEKGTQAHLQQSHEEVESELCLYSYLL